MPLRIGQLFILTAFLVSPNLLYLAGINYGSELGSVFERIHIATYFAAAAFLLPILFHGKISVPKEIRRETFVIILIYAWATAQSLIVGFPVTTIIVTFITSIFAIFLFYGLSNFQKGKIENLILAILLLNSLLGVLELASGITLLPKLAGTLSAANETRSIGLIGHPLTSSFVTGLALVYLVISRLSTKFDLYSWLQISAHTLGLLAFGGRVALLATVAMIAIYVLLDGSTVSRKAAGIQSARRVALIVVAVALTGVIASFGFADNALARFTADNGSAETRNAAFRLITMTPQDRLLFGMQPGERLTLMQNFGTQYGIEVTWIAWIVDYGIFLAIGLVVALLLTLRICLRGAARSHWYMAAFFLICLTGSQGLGSKTMMLTWFVVAMLTFGRVPAPELSIAPNSTKLHEKGALGPAI